MSTHFSEDTESTTSLGLPASFGERLAAIRKARGFTTARSFHNYMLKYWKALNLPVAITYTTYMAYENGTRQPKLDVVAELARFLNTSLDILLNLYNEDYILHFLRSQNYEAHSMGDHIVINMNGNYIGIRKQIMVLLLHEGHKSWSDFLEQYLSKVLSNTFRHFSDKNILAGNDLIGAAMANLLGVDFNEYKESMSHTTRGLKVTFNENPVMALLFFYFTHTNPFENPKLTEEFLNMTYTYSTAALPYEVDYLQKNYPPEMVNMYYYADTMERIDFIDEYLLEVLGMKKSDVYTLKSWFFLGLVGGFHMSEYSYDELDLRSKPTFYLSHLHSQIEDDDDLFVELPEDSVPQDRNNDYRGLGDEQSKPLQSHVHQVHTKMRDAATPYDTQTIHSDQDKPKRLRSVYAKEKL